jgi:hypothetical protein
MKKYKVFFSIFNLFDQSQAEVVKLQQWAKGLTAVITGSTWIASDANHAIMVGIAGFIIDTLIGCLYFEEKKP